MAIYSCNLKSIGRTTHAPGTAGAHIRYIARPEAEPVVVAQHMPSSPEAARNWIDRAERAERKNARMLDKIRIALPKELNKAARAQLVREFMNDLTGGKRVPWFAGIHQSGDDSHNPHVHIAVHDREIGTGKRVLRLSDSTRDRIKAGLPGPKAVEWIRERWEEVCNRALERAGCKERIDRRTLLAQGIDRKPTIHVGPRAAHIDGHVRRPKSKARVNGCGRVINYHAIDKGMTRREFNAQIVDLNLERAARSDNPIAAAWAAFEKEQLAKDRELERRLARERRQRTAEMRNTANRYNAEIRRLRTESRLRLRMARTEIRARYEPQRDALRQKQQRERDDLKSRQGRFYARIIAAMDFTGTTRRRREEARKRLSADHRAERQKLSERYREMQRLKVAAIKDNYEAQLEKAHGKRLMHLSALHEKHESAGRFADYERQQRETDREQSRLIAERKVQEWSKRRTASFAGSQDDEDKGEGKGSSGGGNSLSRAFKKAQERQDTHSQSNKRGHDPGRRMT
ncbi:MAG: MobA/MobL family protein [Rhodospirillaceae bacterium]